ncbi:MAG TPA: tryptophanase [Holophaga sp.]|nr:tryptophanase [Holophaga sp.]HPS66863.1 tryptophanase [Holophaga sp.]
MSSTSIKFSSGEFVPLEMHKVRVVQKLNLLPVEDRLQAMAGAGFNTFLLNNRDVFLDMLTDSGTNAMSDQQVGAMMVADDAYAGSASFERLQEAVLEVFGTPFFLPVHQGRAAEHIVSQAFVGKGSSVPMNFHFTTTKAHVELAGGRVEELYTDEALRITSRHPFKGNMDIGRLQAFIARVGRENIPYIRMEAGTNLIGGQPFSLANLREVRKVADAHGLRIVLDVSLAPENLYFIKTREEEFRDRSIADILRAMCDLADVIYFSARKIGCARGGGIATKDKALYLAMRDMVPLFEGFLTYGGMSVREIEAMAVGLRETLDMNVISQSPQFIKFLVDHLDEAGVPVVTPAGGLGCHLDAMGFLPHVPQLEYPAGALASALFIISGIRGMERGTISMDRDAQGRDVPSEVELLRLAMPRRVFTLSQVKFVEDRVRWLFANRELVGGLRFSEEPKVLRFFVGRLEPTSNWPSKLVARFKEDFGDSL